MWSQHFLSRGSERGRLKKRRKNLEQALNRIPERLATNQAYLCNNCHYRDFVSDDAAYYYSVFGDFAHDETPGFECPNCGGPMIAQY